MYVTLRFCLLEHFHGLFISNVVAHASLSAVISKVAEAHAPVLHDVSGALSALCLLLTAGADAEADLSLIFLEPV